MNNSEQTPEFLEIFTSENKSLHDAYAQTDSAEYYASAFALYIIKPERLNTIAPKTYAYINYDIRQLGDIYSTIYSFNKNR